MFNPIAIILNLWKHRELIFQLTKREVIGRYKGSYLGLLWSFIIPFFMLLVYTFFFGAIFQSRWDVGSGGKAEFALVLFCGLSIYNFFAECVNRAPGHILYNVSYVKKVVFPLEILPVVAAGSALVQALISIVILQIGLVVFLGCIKWTLVFLPLVLLPLLLFVMGIGWFLSSLGTYFRDVGQFISIITQALMFLSPIFYPVSIIPKQFRAIFYLNPLSYVIEDMRRIMIWGELPDWNWLIIGILLGGLVAVLGNAWFQKTRKGFADVL